MQHLAPQQHVTNEQITAHNIKTKTSDSKSNWTEGPEGIKQLEIKYIRLSYVGSLSIDKH
jgi:hypothetical protein